MEVRSPKIELSAELLRKKADSRGEFFLSYQLLETFFIPWFMGPSSILKASSLASLKRCFSLSLSLSLCLSLSDSASIVMSISLTLTLLPPSFH